MNIGEYSIKSKVVSWLLVVIMLGGGILAFDSMGKLEDPNFTIKSAKIMTQYPGATALEVQNEVAYVDISRSRMAELGIDVREIGDLLISSQDKRLVYLKDIATITRAYSEVPAHQCRNRGWQHQYRHDPQARQRPQGY